MAKGSKTAVVRSLPDLRQVLPPSKPKIDESVDGIYKGTKCLHCNKSTDAGYYGRWGDEGVCSKICNNAVGEKRHPSYYK